MTVVDVVVSSADFDAFPPKYIVNEYPAVRLPGAIVIVVPVRHVDPTMSILFASVVAFHCHTKRALVPLRVPLVLSVGRHEQIFLHSTMVPYGKPRTSTSDVIETEDLP